MEASDTSICFYFQLFQTEHRLKTAFTENDMWQGRWASEVTDRSNNFKVSIWKKIKIAYENCKSMTRELQPKKSYTQ